MRILTPDLSLSKELVDWSVYPEHLLAYGATFRKCRLESQSIRSAQFFACTWFGSVLDKSKLMNVAFFNGDLRNMHFVDCQFEDVTFSLLSLRNTSFENCNFKRCNFFDLDVTATQWQNTSITKSLITRIDFSSALVETLSFSQNHVEDCRLPESLRTQLTHCQMRDVEMVPC